MTVRANTGIQDFYYATKMLEQGLNELEMWLKGGNPDLGTNLERTTLYFIMQNFLQRRKSGDLKDSNLPTAEELESRLSSCTRMGALPFQIESNEQRENCFQSLVTQSGFKKLDDLTEELIRSIEQSHFIENFHVEALEVKIGILEEAIKLLNATERGRQYLWEIHNSPVNPLSIFDSHKLQEELESLHIVKRIDPETGELVEGGLRLAGSCLKLFRRLLTNIILPLEAHLLKKEFLELSPIDQADALLRHYDKFLEAIKRSKIELEPTNKEAFTGVFQKIRTQIADVLAESLSNSSFRNYKDHKEKLKAFVNHAVWKSADAEVRNALKDAQLPDDLSLKKLDLTRNDLIEFTDGMKYFGTTLGLALQLNSFYKGDRTLWDKMRVSMDLAEMGAMIFDIYKVKYKGVSSGVMTWVSLRLAPIYMMIPMYDAYVAFGNENTPLMLGHLATAASTAIFTYMAYATAANIAVGFWPGAIANVLMGIGIYATIKYAESQQQTNLKKFFKYNYFGKEWHKVEIERFPFEFHYGFRTSKLPPEYRRLSKVESRYKRSLISKFYSILYPINITSFKNHSEYPYEEYHFTIEPDLAPLTAGGFHLFVQIHVVRVADRRGGEIGDNYYGEYYYPEDPIPDKRSKEANGLGNWRFFINEEGSVELPGVVRNTDEFHLLAEGVRKKNIQFGTSSVPTYEALKLIVKGRTRRTETQFRMYNYWARKLYIEVGLVLSKDHFLSQQNNFFHSPEGEYEPFFTLREIREED